MTSVATTIRTVLSLDPAAQALEYQGLRITWGDLAVQAQAIQARLDGLKLGPGARIGILLRNRPLQYAAALACLVSGRCLVTLNPALPDARLCEDLASLELPVVIGEAEDLERTGARDALRTAGSAAIRLPASLLETPALLAGFEQSHSDASRREQPSVIIEMLTSGTTGKPKRIPLLAAAFQRGFDAGNAYERGRDGDDRPKLRSGVVFLTLPFTHISGLWALIQQVAGGRMAVLMEKFQIAEWHAAVKKHRPKLISGPPTMLRMILDAGLPREDLSSILALRTGTAPLDPAIVDEFYQRYGIPVLQNYGATEFAGAVAGWTLDDFKRWREAKRGSVGRLQAGVEARIVDAERGAPVPAGEEGLLELRGPQLNSPEHWIRTTDRAVLDADGFLFIRGRADNAILRGGFKVHPDDVVQALETHPAVREACVVGIEDRRLGQVPVAALLLRTGAAPPSPEELGQYLRGRLAPYQIPVHFKIVEELPRTPSMKVSQPDVRALFAQECLQ